MDEAVGKMGYAVQEGGFQAADEPFVLCGGGEMKYSLRESTLCYFFFNRNLFIKMAAFGGRVDTYRSKDAKTNSMTFSTLRDRCRRESDYIITLVFTNEVSLFITWLLLKTRVMPNHVTIASLACGIICGFSYLAGWFFFGSFFLFMSHVLDCADGNLARAKEMFSPFGRWLDSIGDKTADVFIFLCVGLYFYKNNDSDIWTILALLDALLLLLYYYIVDIALSLGISDKKQK